MQSRIVAALVWAIVALSPAAQAFGPFGTALVAELAQRQLTPQAKAEADRLLGLIQQREFAVVANWAGNLDKDPQTQALWQKTRDERFVKYGSDDCLFQPARDCADGVCAVAAIERNRATLSDPAAPDQARIAALLFLMHHVADAHSPLNNSFKNDQGGYDYAVTVAGKKSNLRQVWDEFLLAFRQQPLKAYADRLAAELPAAGEPTPASWSQDSCALVRDGDIYPRALSARRLPDASDAEAGESETSNQEWQRRGTSSNRSDDLFQKNEDSSTVGQRYFKRFTPVAEQQVTLASVRLAQLLNAALVAGRPQSN